MNTYSQSEWRTFHKCPRQYRWKSDDRFAEVIASHETMDRQRRTLLGTVVDDVIAQMYIEKWLRLPHQLVEILNQTAAERLDALLPSYSVAEPAAVLLYELRPVWVNIAETVRAERLLAAQTYVRQDFAKVFSHAILKGQPDLVFEDTDALHVVDVKLRARSSLDTKQIHVYRILTEHVLRKPVLRNGFWLPREARLYWAPTKKQRKLEIDIDTDLTRMVRGEDGPQPGTHCQFCPVRTVCPEGATYMREKAGSTVTVTGDAYHGRAQIVGF